MKILQINAWQGRILRRLLNFIRAEQPDIILSQEVFSFPGDIAPGSPLEQRRTLELMQIASGLDHVYFSPSINYSSYDHVLGYGNAILSRFPFAQTSTHYTEPFKADPPSNLTNFHPNTGRNFQHITIEPQPQSPLHIINHHAHWAPNDQGDATSTERILKLGQYAKILSGPLLIGGDFNVQPDSKPAQALLGQLPGFENLINRTKATTTLSAAHHTGIPVVCDHVLISPELECTDVTVSDNLVSDHLAVTVTIKD